MFKIKPSKKELNVRVWERFKKLLFVKNVYELFVKYGTYFIVYFRLGNDSIIITHAN